MFINNWHCTCMHPACYNDKYSKANKLLLRDSKPQWTKSTRHATGLWFKISSFQSCSKHKASVHQNVTLFDSKKGSHVILKLRKLSVVYWVTGKCFIANHAPGRCLQASFFHMQSLQRQERLLLETRVLCLVLATSKRGIGNSIRNHWLMKRTFIIKKGLNYNTLVYMHVCGTSDCFFRMLIKRILNLILWPHRTLQIHTSLPPNIPLWIPTYSEILGRCTRGMSISASHMGRSLG